MLLVLFVKRAKALKLNEKAKKTVGILVEINKTIGMQ